MSSHGSHWDAVLTAAGTDARLMDLLVGAMSECTGTVIAEAPAGQVELCSSAIEPGVDLQVVIQAGQMTTAFPIVRHQHFVRGTITEVGPWDNGLEAWVNLRIGPAVLTFFAVDYLIHKEAYLVGYELDVALTGLAYSVDPPRQLSVQTPEGPVTGKEICIIQNGQFPGVMPDDFVFQGRIDALEPTKSGNLLTIQMVEHPALNLCLPVYVHAENTHAELGNGHFISGTMWLQGGLVD